jgi:hypothetical protein
MLKTEVRRLTGQNPDRSLMYPGEWVFTWARMPGAGIWVLIGIEPKEA